MNGKEYTEWQMGVSQQLAAMNQTLRQLKSWTEKRDTELRDCASKHERDNDAILKRLASLETSRTWFKGVMYTIGTLLAGGIAAGWRKIVG